MLTTSSIEKEIFFDVLSNPGDMFYENVLSDFLDEQGIEHDFRNSLHNNPVEELKSYQEKCLDIWKNYWVNIYLCTKPTNKNKAEQYFYDFYKQMGLESPKSIIWFSNPMEMWRTAYNQEGDWMINRVWSMAWMTIIDYLSNSVCNKVWHYLYDNVAYNSWNSVTGQVWNCVLPSTSNPVNNKLWYGQHDAWWLGFYSYIMQVLRAKISKTFILLIFLAQEVNWWFASKESLYIVEKPKECIVKNNRPIKLVYQDGYTTA